MALRIGGLEVSDSLLAINPHLREIAGVRQDRAPRWLRPVEATARREGDRVVLLAKGLVLVSEQNAREHHHVRARRAAWQRSLVARALAGIDPVPVPCAVTIVRSGPRLLDDDNATGSAKHVRDAVARWLGVDDGDPRVSWLVVQDRGAYCVRVGVVPCA